MANLQHTDVGSQLSEAEFDGNAAHYSGTIGDLIYASTTTILSGLAAVATGQVLISGGVGAAPSWSATPSVTGVTVGASGISLGANKLIGTTAYLKQDAASKWSVRKVSDDDFGNLEAQDVTVDGNLVLNGQSLAAYNGDAGIAAFKARDTGVGLVEVARLQGAADAYFQATLALRLNPIATASLPGTPVEGMLVYDDTVNKLKFYNGAAWETVTSAV